MGHRLTLLKERTGVVAEEALGGARGRIVTKPEPPARIVVVRGVWLKADAADACNCQPGGRNTHVRRRAKIHVSKRTRHKAQLLAGNVCILLHSALGDILSET